MQDQAPGVANAAPETGESRREGALGIHHTDREFELVGEAVCTWRLDEIPAKLLRSLKHVHQNFYLPTLHCVSAPQMVMPREGRVYLTDYYEIEQRLIDETTYKAFLGDTDVGRVGGKNTFLVEVFEKKHGGAEYRQVGWALMTKAQLETYLSNIAAD